jgi:glycosyltransferase involved in cell wall biosynthesis
LNPKLSILIPAYNYKLGVLRILNLIDSSLMHKIEILIFDDSHNNDLLNETSIFNLDILYVHNSPSLGAVHNWNKLIERARGDYLFLLHHDEFPYTKNFFTEVLECLDRDREIDLLVLDLVLLRKDKHINSFINFSVRKFLISKVPKYLSLRNFVGPVSTLIIKKSFCPSFNTKFKWLVDVVFYLEILEKNPKILFSKELIIISEFQREESITSMLRQNVRHLSNKERFLLNKLNHNLSFYLSSSLLSHFFRFFELIVWGTIIFIGRIFGNIKFILLKF